MSRLLDDSRAAPSSTISTARLPAQKSSNLVVDQRIGDVEHIERDARLAIDVGEAEHAAARAARALYMPP